jgi:hypothetical protein
MTKVKLIYDCFVTDVADRVEEFLNQTKGIQILDISWFAVGYKTVCAITYFEVE